VLCFIFSLAKKRFTSSQISIPSSRKYNYAMAEGGYENPAFDPYDPSLDDRDHEDNNDDDDQDSKETTPFWPGSASTPGPHGEEIPMQTMQQEKSGQPGESYVELPSFKGFIPEDDKPAMVERAEEFIKRKYPRVDFEN